MKTIRPSFDEAVSGFHKFLQEQGWSDCIVWITRDRITGYRKKYWILKPNELADDITTRQFYEQVRQTDSSIRMDGFAQHNGATLAYVEDYGGPSKMMNYGVILGERTIKSVSSDLAWLAIVTLNHLRGESPFLKSTQIAQKCRA